MDTGHVSETAVNLNPNEQDQDAVCDVRNRNTTFVLRKDPLDTASLASLAIEVAQMQELDPLVQVVHPLDIEQLRALHESEKANNQNEQDPDVVRDVRNRVMTLLMKNTPIKVPSSLAEELAHLHPGFESTIVETFFLFYNRDQTDVYDYMVALFLCQKNSDFKLAFESYLVQRCKRMQVNMQMRRNHMTKMVRVFAALLKYNCLSWHILAHFSVERSQMTPIFATFCRAFFEELTKKGNNYKTMLKKLRDKEVLQSIEAVYPERGKRDERFYVKYFDSLGGFLPIWHTLQLGLS